MPGSFAIELAEAANVVERDRRLPQGFVVGIHGLNASEMECRPEQHGGMAVRKHKAIAIGPDRVLRIKFEDTIPYRIDEWRERHGRSGVPGVGLLHGIDGERANRVDTQLIEFCGAEILDWSYYGTHDCLRLNVQIRFLVLARGSAICQNHSVIPVNAAGWNGKIRGLQVGKRSRF